MNRNQLAVEDEIFLCDEKFFKDDEEHCYSGLFRDGFAVLKVAPGDYGVPNQVILTYPTVEEIENNPKLKAEVNEYSGMEADTDVTVYPIALRFGKISKVEDIKGKLLDDLLDAIDYSFLQTDGTYDKALTHPVIDKVNYIKKLIKQ